MENEKTNISVLILAKNEQEMIAACIRAATLLNPLEILVFDDHSTDDTKKIAENSGAKVIAHAHTNFAQARNFAAQKARGEWLLYIDADEIVTNELAQEIKKELSSQMNAFFIERVNYFLGKKWPQKEQLLRLMRKSALSAWKGAVHETAEVVGERAKLKSPLLHYTHRTLEEMVANTIQWSAIEARLRFENNHPPVVWWRIPRVMLTAFVDSYIKQRGYQVGVVGLIESIYQSFSMYITYARLWEMQQKHV